jgi:hypothetical protein
MAINCKLYLPLWNQVQAWLARRMWGKQQKGKEKKYRKHEFISLVLYVNKKAHKISHNPILRYLF